MPTYGIIGDPVEHSLSAPMHEAAFEALDIDARFCRFPVKPKNLFMAIKGAQALNIDGLTVTMPHKQTVLDLDLIEPVNSAQISGAVNTIDLHKMRGYNTDGYGCVQALRKHNVTVEEAQILLIGAGGAGRAIGTELANTGARVAIANLEIDMAIELCEIIRDLGGAADAYDLNSLVSLVDEAAIVINATSVGMDEDQSLIGPEALKRDQVVLDAVYTPIETRLLRNARQAGARAISGAWMLLYQGTKAFEIWTGQEAPAESMKMALWDYLDEA